MLDTVETVRLERFDFESRADLVAAWLQMPQFEPTGRPDSGVCADSTTRRAASIG